MLLLLFTTTAPYFLPSLAPMLKRVDVGDCQYCSYAKECVEVKFYSNHIVVEYYDVEKGMIPPRIEILRSEGMQMAAKWKSILLEWGRQKFDSA